MLSTLQEKLTSTERPYALAEAIKAVRPCGIVSVPGSMAAGAGQHGLDRPERA